MTFVCQSNRTTDGESESHCGYFGYREREKSGSTQWRNGVQTGGTLTLTDEWDLSNRAYVQRDYHWNGSAATTYRFGVDSVTTGEAHYTGYENDSYGEHNWGTDYDFGDGSLTYHHDNPDPDANPDDHWEYGCNNIWGMHEHFDLYGNPEVCDPPLPNKFASGMSDSSPPFSSSLGNGGAGLSYNSDWANVAPSKPADVSNVKPNLNPPPGGWPKPNGTVPQSSIVGAFFSGALSGVHNALDIAGMIPVVGEAADAANVLIYTIERDYPNAAVSAVSMVPVVGVLATVGKFGKKAVQAAENVAKHADDVADAAGVVIKHADEAKIGIGKPFSAKQKKEILEANKAKNDGILRSDKSGIDLIPSQKSQKGVTPPTNEAQVDHVIPRSKGGSNSLDNAQVLSREENRAKSNIIPPSTIKIDGQ